MSNTDPQQSGEIAVLDADDRAHLQRSLGRLDRLAHLMDDQFELPILERRIGLDPIIGLIPGGGDWATWLIGVYIFWESLRLGAPKSVLTRMVLNLVIDLTTGYVPAVGDLFDAAFKANRKNVDLLLEHYGASSGDGAPRLPETLPVPREEYGLGSRVVRYLVGFLVVLGLFGLAALPFVLIWWVIKG